MDERPGSLNLSRLVSEGIVPLRQKQSDKEREKSMEI